MIPSSSDLLPSHTCYVEVWPDYQRIFEKKPSPVEVCNDHGATARLFCLVRDHPELLLSATQAVSNELVTYQRILAAWNTCHGRISTDHVLASREELRAILLEPFLRLRTVLFEDLDWRCCLERYNDPRTFMILSPPWTEEQRDEWAALQLRLARARFHWKLIIPPHVQASLAIRVSQHEHRAMRQK
jgi:hypothetical protein